MATDKDKPESGSAAGARPGSSSSNAPSGGERKPVTIDLESKPVNKSGDTGKSGDAGKPEQSGMAAKAAASTSAPSPDDAVKSDAAKGEAAGVGAASQSVKSDKPISSSSASVKASSPASESAKSGGDAPKDAKSAADSSAQAKPWEKAAEKSAETASAKTAPASPSKAAPEAIKAPPSSVERSGAGMGSVFFAGLLGAAIVAGGGYGLLKSGYLPMNQVTGDGDLNAALEASQSRIATLESRLAEIAQSAPQQGASALTALEGRVAAVESSLGEATTDATSAIKQEVDALNSGLAELRRFVSSGNAGESAGLASLQKSQEDIQASLGDISTRVAKAEESAATISTLGDELSGLRGSVTEANSAVAELKTGLANLSSELTVKVAANATSLATLQDKLATLEERFEPLEESLGDISSREVAARALSVSALRSALDAGRPYETELAAVRAAVPQDTDLTSLAAHAEKGIPAKAALIGAFPATVRAMSAALDRPAENDLVGSLLSNARSLVSVRRVGEGGGESAVPDAGLGQMEARVDAGDLAGALEAFAALPEPARAAGAEWADQAQARVEADKLVGEVTDTVLKGLADSGS